MRNAAFKKGIAGLVFLFYYSLFNFCFNYTVVPQLFKRTSSVPFSHAANAISAHHQKAESRNGDDTHPSHSHAPHENDKSDPCCAKLVKEPALLLSGSERYYTAEREISFVAGVFLNSVEPGISGLLPSFLNHSPPDRKSQNVFLASFALRSPPGTACL